MMHTHKGQISNGGILGSLALGVEEDLRRTPNHMTLGYYPLAPLGGIGPEKGWDGVAGGWGAVGSGGEPKEKKRKKGDKKRKEGTHGGMSANDLSGPPKVLE